MHQEFDPRDLEPALPPREARPARSKFAPAMIAAIALAGFGGVVYYAYDKGVRQSDGTAPLIKADTSPTKVKPEQPGGMEVPHQDKLVLNALADATKNGGPPVERLLPPPEAPLPRPTPTANPAQLPAVVAGAAVGAATATALVGGQPGTAAAPAPLPPKIGPAPTPTAAPGVAAPAMPAQTQTAAAPAPLAPPPAAKPAAQPAAAPAAAPKPAPAPVAATPVATGGSGFRVQLVSVKSQDQASVEWARLQKHFPELGSLRMSVAKADLGDKGVYYRVQAGPIADKGAANQLCSTIKSKDKSQGCMVVAP